MFVFMSGSHTLYTTDGCTSHDVVPKWIHHCMIARIENNDCFVCNTIIVFIWSVHRLLQLLGCRWRLYRGWSNEVPLLWPTPTIVC